MKKFLVGLLIVSPVAMATQMQGFGATYYQDDSTITDYSTNRSLVPNVVVGDNTYVMENSSLSNIARTAHTVVNQDSQASWICLNAKEVNYWFISDNEMGNGDLTAIAVAKDGKHERCSSYSGDLNVTVKGIPLLGSPVESIASVFSNQPDGDKIQYCSETRRYGDYTQSNCLQYYLENKKTVGVVISQITTN
jgi:hypothetical protein